VVTLVFFGSLGIIPFLGVSFMPTADTGEISVVATLDSGLSDEAATKVTKQIEAFNISGCSLDVFILRRLAQEVPSECINQRFRQEGSWTIGESTLQ